MMRKINLLPEIVMALAISALFINACKKSDITDSFESAQSTEVRTASENALAESSFDDVGNVADEGVTGSLESYRSLAETGNEKVLTSCASISLNLQVVPHTAVIDFGTENCLGKDGNYRRGKILVSWTGNYRDEGSVHTISTENFYLNFNKIEGSKTVTNTGRNSEGNLVYTVKVNGTIITDPQYNIDGNSGTIYYSANKTRVWTEGENTLKWKDDVYLVSGNATGTNTDGITYIAFTDEDNALKKEIGFPHFTSGVVTIRSEDPTFLPAVVDYSYIDGQRDDLARVTINNKTFTIHLGIKAH